MAVKDFLNRLPDVFTKSEKSNIGKLFVMVDQQITQLRDTLTKAEEWRSIDSAAGKTLDYLGENVGQNRGRTTDEIYRVLIRGKVARNASDGTINRMIDALAISLNCEHAEIHIMNANDTEDEKEPAAIVLKKVPLTAINSVGISTNQIVQMINSMKAGGVRVASVNLEGTFSFASGNVIEIDSEKGFADIEGTTGGFFGGVFTPSEDYQLPI